MLSEEAHFQYKCTDYYNSEDDYSLLWSDKSLNIEWKNLDKIVSKKDERGIQLKDTKPIII